MEEAQKEAEKDTGLLLLVLLQQSLPSCLGSKRQEQAPQQEVSASRLACKSLRTWGPACRQWVLKPGRREGQEGQGGGTELRRLWWGFPNILQLNSITLTQLHMGGDDSSWTPGFRLGGGKKS